MKLLQIWIWITVLVIGTVARADTVQELRAYVWGNSLIHHLTNDDDTTMPHWLNRLARADGRSLELSGQWVFGNQFPDKIPPEPQWSFKEVTHLWHSDREAFDATDVNTVLINPENFIQYRAPDLPYEGANPDGRSPLSGTVDLINWVTAQGVRPTVFLYEGWAEMDSFPPTRRKYRRYLRYTLGEYHDWYQDYHNAVAAAVPGMDVRLIPVGSILTKLITEGPLTELRPTDLYLDNSPHGTATTYLIAAMITYAGVYNAPPPAGFDQFSPSISDKLIDNYPATADFIWQEMQGYAAPRAEQRAEAPAPDAPVSTPEEDVAAAPQPSAPTPVQPAPVQPATDLPDASQANAEGLANPSMAMGLNGIADWSTQHPFVDIMKTARPWLGHLRGQWGGYEFEKLAEDGFLDAQGWLRRIPDGVDRVETYFLTEQPPEATALAARYRVTWEGTGKVDIVGLGRTTQRDENGLWFVYEPADGLVALSIRETDPQRTGDYIRNIRIVREDHLPLFEAGVVYNPEFTTLIKDLRSIRYMDWMFTNGSPKRNWDDRARVDDFTYVRRGVPVEHMVRLANLIGADPWFNMPHMADDTYVRNFAQQVRATLDPRLRPIAEYSNELWNRVFPQTTWAVEQARERWGAGAPDDAWMQFAGMRGAQVMQIWEEVYGNDTDFLPTLGVQTGWPGLEEPMLDAPLYVAEGGTPPRDHYRGYAVSGYFGHYLGMDEEAPAVMEIVQGGIDRATKSGQAEGLRRVALREYVLKHRFKGTFAPVAQRLRDGSVRELVGELWAYHARVAQNLGMEMLMYEGGTHVAGVGDWREDETLTAYYTALNYSPEMGAIYADLLQAWKDAGGTMFNAFVDVAPASKFGSWGNLRHLQDSTPRWDALTAFNRDSPAWWESRRPDTFLHGVVLYGSDRSERFEGTTEEDILIAGGGNDELISHGRSDHLNGGPGTDTAVLPGIAEDYVFTRDGARIIATYPLGQITLRDIEIIRFSDDVELPLDALL
ncbi:calcium-binding protein [Primorskyibacter aestuariivivens]|uniref:calcium-binding protein n=1 Tax=Primorskyibacter aestuariivivens TaxID=1888912 RepID=UPI002300E575|nr:calcium-binding protein [Primorskyibacter aestuariivivens]MDA7429901.1 calcium-binding protein [Primorskyibacter aestuariivivens]